MERETIMPEGTDTPEIAQTEVGLTRTHNIEELLAPLPRRAQQYSEQPIKTGTTQDETQTRLRTGSFNPQEAAITRKEGDYWVYLDSQGRELGRLPVIAGGAHHWEQDSDVESLTIRSEYGEQEVHWPKDNKHKIARMRAVLSRMEATNQEDGGPAVGSLVREVGGVVSALLTHKDNAYRETGEAIQLELYARIRLHRAFLQFIGGGSVKEVGAAANSLGAQDFNTLFRTEDFRRSLNYYEQHAITFLSGTLEAKQNFRREVRSILAQAHGEDLNDPNVLSRYFGWQNMAERFWQISGRMAMFYRTLPNDPNIDETEQRKKGDVKWNGATAPGSNFALRRLFRFREYLETQVKNMRPHAQLIDGIDFKIGDFFTTIVTGGDQFKSLNNSEKFVRADGTLDFEAVDWDNFDFHAVDASGVPMNFWAFRKISQPDGARDALIEKSDSYLRNPNENTLGALIDLFDYQEADRWTVKKQLIINFARFAMQERSSVTGKRKYSDEAVMAMINNLTGLTDENKAPFIHPKDRQEVIQRVNEMIGQPRAFLSRPDVKLTYAFLGGFLAGMIAYIWNLIKGDIKSGK